MSQQDGNTSENQRAEMLDSRFTSLEVFVTSYVTVR